MPTATLTSKGQITLPKVVRECLHLQTGDAVDFIIVSADEIHVRAGRIDVLDLQGMLKKPGRKPVSLEAMDDAIRTAQQRTP
jgi:AbrB family looped-hinge helix DNA binding protein